MDQQHKREEAKGCCRFCRNKCDLSKDDIGKATSFWLFSLKRPHMRAFHASWFGFFTAFLGWFCVQPLIPYIKEDLGLTDEEVANSGIAAVAAVIVIRIAAGPFCDRFGSRRVMIFLLVAGSIPVGLAGLVSNGLGLITIRLFIGILGGVFVPCQMWTTSMFSGNIVGSTNALAGGWGNLGGGVTFLVMPALYNLLKYNTDLETSQLWKVTLVIPACIGLLLAVPYWFLTDDCPQGPWHLRRTQFAVEIKDENKKINGHINKAYCPEDDDIENSSGLPVTESNSNLSVSTNKRIEALQDGWRGHFAIKIIAITILFLQYAACFGVEISINSILNIYLLRKFKTPNCNITDPSGEDKDYKCSVLTRDTASLIASLFGLMNLFARFTGGFVSDICHKRWPISGRIIVHFVIFLLEGALMIVFGNMDTVPSAIAVLILWSLTVQNAEGSTYSIVPFVWPKRVGVVAGIVAAGGNLGGICWNTLWRFSLNNMSQYFTIVGCIAIFTGLLNVFLIVAGYHMTDPMCLRQGDRNDPEGENKNDVKTSQIVSKEHDVTRL